MYLAIHKVFKFKHTSKNLFLFRIVNAPEKGEMASLLVFFSPIPALCRSSVNMGGVNGRGGYYISPDF